MNVKRFFSELKRRNVHKVAFTYGITAWLIAQISGLVTSSFQTAPWVMKMIIIILIIGFPIILVFSWIFEMSSEGFVKTVPADVDETENEGWSKTWLLRILLLIFVLMVAGYWSWEEFGVNDQQISSLAVLPFDNFSADEDQEYIASGLQDNLITTVSKISALRVISRPSTVQYKNSAKTSTEIAKELGVDAIIKASVIRFEDVIQINVQLIRTEPEERNIWTQKFEAPANEVYALFNEVSQALAHEINISLTTDEESELSNARQVDPEAYKAYLKGRVYWDMLTPDGLDKAQDYYELALKFDPDFAAAYAGIAGVWTGRRQMGYTSDKEAYKEAKLAIDRAFAIDSLEVEVLYNYAISVGWMEWDWENVTRSYEKALELNPSHANAHAYYSNFLITRLEFDKAKTHMDQALKLDPYNELIQGLYRINLSVMGQCDELLALEAELGSSGPLSKSALQNCLLHKGMFDKALAHEIELARLFGNKELENILQNSYDKGLYREAFLKKAQLWEQNAEELNIRPWKISILYANLKDKEKALFWLERAYKEHDPNVPYAGAAPVYDFVREEERFKTILKQLRLPLP